VSASSAQWWHRHAATLRIVVGCILGIAILAALLRIRSEVHRAGGVLTTLRSANRGVFSVAVVLEATAYVLPGVILRRLVPELRLGRALRIAVASLGVGPLVPGNPVSGSGIGFAELRRARVPSPRAATAAFALVIAIPAASTAILAGPALIGSGLAAPLPAGWRGVVLVAGSLAIALAIGIVVAVARGTREDRAGCALGALGGSRSAVLLLLLGVAAALADAACLWLTGVALHVHLPLSSLPIAYIAGVAIMSLPVLPGGLGAVEVTLPAVFAAGGASYAAAVLVVVTWRLLSFWLPTAAGIIALTSLHRPRPSPVRT
jgi:uncharacterized membrane protein YbhN (UPF0104 family)